MVFLKGMMLTTTIITIMNHNYTIQIDSYIIISILIIIYNIYRVTIRLFIMFNSCLYVFVYCNAENILNKLYFSHFDIYNINNELITSNQNFNYSMKQLNIFVLCVYILFILNNFLYYNSVNKYSIALALVYIKYTLNIMLNDNITINEYEISRNIMWLFATPLMMQIFCDINNLDLKHVNIHLNIIPNIINVLIYPYKNTYYYYYFLYVNYFLLYFFMKKLYYNKEYVFARIYLFIWSIFIGIHIVEILNVKDKYSINLYYLSADVVSKVATSMIVNDYNSREINIKKSVDLQTINFIAYMMDSLKQYTNDNTLLSKPCDNYIKNIKKHFLLGIPENKDFLKKELLQKLLPFDFDIQYIENTIIDSTSDVNVNTKQYNMICILFTDIVNYTELAKQYNDKTIFQLLNKIYNKFDNIKKKYAHLQKVETIGDAYMIVGDIFRKQNNHKIVIKEIILIAIEFIKEIKTIKTPDNIPLSIRIGINMGNVSIGILGNEIPRLCVVGNAVNVAARLQSTADIDTIQMSRHIYEQLEEIDFNINLDIKTKENVFLKNIGSVITYNIRPDF